MSYTAKEMNGSGVEKGNADGQSATRVYHVTPYSARKQFVLDKLGYRRKAGDSFQEQEPAAFASDEPNLKAVSYVIEGLGKPSQDSFGDATYDGGAKITIEFSTRPEEVFAEESLSFSAKSIPLEKESLEWASDSEQLAAADAQVSKQVVQGEIVITRMKVPDFDKSSILSALGKVNSVTWNDAAAETLLFVGARTQRTHTAEGVQTRDVELVFAYDPNGWNNAFRASTGAFAAVRTKNGNADLYESTDLSTLVPEEFDED